MICSPFAQEDWEHFDLWSFIKHREQISGSIALAETQELGKYAASPDAALQFSIESLESSEGEHAELKIALQTSLQLECQRCLEPLLWDYEREFSLLVFASESQAEQAALRDDYLVCAKTQKMDLQWFLQEEILLAMPMIAKHENCSLPLAQEIRETPTAETNNPFAALKQLLK